MFAARGFILGGGVGGRRIGDDRRACRRVLREIVVNNQGVHAVVHEPFAHGGAGERREILVGGGIARRGGKHNGVGHRAGFFEHGDDPRHAGLFLADCHVDAVQRAVILVAGGFRRFVRTERLLAPVKRRGRLRPIARRRRRRCPRAAPGSAGITRPAAGLGCQLIQADHAWISIKASCGACRSSTR